MNNIFRGLVIVSSVLLVVLWLLPQLYHEVLDSQALDLLTWSGYNAFIEMKGWFSWVLLSIYLSINLGVFFYLNIFRVLFLISFVLSLISSIFLGFVVYTPIDMVISHILSAIDGAILILIFLTSVSRSFSGNS